MEGMQATCHLTGVNTQKPVWTATFVAMTTHIRPSALRDSHCALISACMRFHPYPVFQVLRLTRARYQLDDPSFDQALAAMNEPV